MSYVNEWAPAAAIWGFVVLLFVPYLGPLVVGLLLLVAAIALVREAFRATVAAVTALGRFAHQTWPAFAKAIPAADQDTNPQHGEASLAVN